jgi:methyl-accepting chemotaxis protein
VKALAAQTAQATSEIGSQIGEIQAATADSVMRSKKFVPATGRYRIERSP